MIDTISQEYSQTLNQLGIEHTVFEHPAMIDPNEVQAYLHETIADCVATLVMKADDRFIAILKKGDSHLNFKKIKKLLHVGNLRFASKEEFEQKTGLPFGAARVYLPGIDTYIDQHVFDQEYLNGGTGSFTCTFKYKTVTFKNIPNYTVVDITDSIV